MMKLMLAFKKYKVIRKVLKVNIELYEKAFEM